MNQQLNQRIGREPHVDFAQQRIRNLFNIDILQNVQFRRTQFIKQIHPNPKSLIQQGYVVHTIPLRNCDKMKIFHQPKEKLNHSPIPKQMDQVPQIISDKIQRIMTTVKNDRSMKISIDNHSNTVAKMPAFYTKHQSNSKTQQSILSNESIGIRIRSLSRVKDNVQDSQLTLQRLSTQNRKKRLSQYKQQLQQQVNNFMQDSYFN